jgi:hypothetical protein
VEPKSSPSAFCTAVPGSIPGSTPNGAIAVKIMEWVSTVVICYKCLSQSIKIQINKKSAIKPPNFNDKEKGSSLLMSLGGHRIVF